MNMLGGGVAALFGEVMAPLYLRAKLRSVSTTYDTKGGQTRTGNETECLVQVDGATESMRAAEGYAATDRSLIFLETSLSGPLTSDAQVTVLEGPHAGSRWRVANPIDRDPAGSYRRCRAVALEGDE